MRGILDRHHRRAVKRFEVLAREHLARFSFRDDGALT